MSGTGFTSPPRELLTVDGHAIAVRRHGSGEPALMVHGLGGMASNWTDLMHACEHELRSCAMDMPGFGGSDPLPGRFRVPDLARVVIRTIETEFPGAAVHLFGNSLGGCVALQVADERPDLVRSLTLVSPAMPRYRTRRTNVQVPLVVAPIVGRRLFARWAALPADRRAWGTVSIVYGNPRAIHPVRWQEILDETVRHDRAPHATPVYLQAIRAMLRWFLQVGARHPWRRFARLPMPVLVVHGSRDLLVDPREGLRAARERPGTTVAIFMDAAHVAMMEFPLEVARLWRSAVLLTR